MDPTLLDTTVIVEGGSESFLWTFLAIVLTALGAWLLTKRSEWRSKRARLTALERELRVNGIIVDAVLERRNPRMRLSREMWDATRIDLSVDLPTEVYDAVYTSYMLFDDHATRVSLILETQPDGPDFGYLADWRAGLRTAQALVVGELNPHWKWGLQASEIRKRLRRKARPSPPSTAENPQGAEGR
jgi:hypothetical protein